jgi:hypothetical protein
MKALTRTLASLPLQVICTLQPWFFRGTPAETRGLCVTLLISMLQIFTGLIPFHNIKHDYRIMGLVLKGERPPRPVAAETVGCSEVVWNHMQRCWQENPRTRPTCRELLDVVEIH